MNGVHDMGGMHGFGPVVVEADEPVFHTAWEARVRALEAAVAALGMWTVDEERHSIEQMPPGDYLSASYYEKWLWSLEQRLHASQLLDEGETPSQRILTHVLRLEGVASLLGKYGARRDDTVSPRFEVGDRVHTRNDHPRGHTRLPRYARGRKGVVWRDHGVFPFPDTRAARKGDRPQHVYSVRFAARELWGSTASSLDHVHLDVFDDYLEAS